MKFIPPVYKTYKHCFSAEELYVGLSKKWLKGLWVKNRYKDRRKLAAKIFIDCFFEILLDIIDNNVTFVLPLKYGKVSEICMRQYAGEEFKDMYKKGCFNKIDFVSSQFTANRLLYTCRTRSGLKHKPIYVNKELNNKIIKYTYEAKQYY